MLAGLVIYIGAIAAGGYEEILSAVTRLDLLGWVVILGLSLVNYGLRFVRWHLYLRRLGHQTPAGDGLLCYLAGFAFTTTPGKAGEAVRALYLKEHGVGYTHSVAALFVERVLDLVVMVSLAALTMFYFKEGRWPLAVAGGLLLGCLPLIRSELVRSLLERWAGRATGKKLKFLLQRLAYLSRAAVVLLARRILYTGLLLGLVGWAAEGVAFYYILRWIGVDAPMAVAVGIYALSVLIGALSFIPGGLGSTEAAMGLLLLAVGAGPVEAVAATLVCRAATLWFAVVIGVMALGTIEVTRVRAARAWSR